MASKRIVIQGDDLGYTPEANEGIKYSYEYGVLTSTTVMANLLTLKDKSYYRNFIEGLKNRSGIQKPKIGIGVHLNLTYGKPLSSNWHEEKFTRPYKGSNKPEEWQGKAWAKYFSSFDPAKVEEEYRMQIELALEIFGSIDHLDSHHFTASYEPMKKIYEKLAKEYLLAVRPDAPLSEKPVYGGDFQFNEVNSTQLKQKGIKVPNRLVLNLFFNEKDPIESLLMELNNIKEEEIVEVMFHPGRGDNAEFWRKIDTNILTNDKVKKYFKEKKAELISYGQI